MIEEVPIATALDRGRVLLQRSGQATCALTLAALQTEFNYIAEALNMDPNKPVEIVKELWDRCLEAI
jgi:hypothetical protein